ncbi:MAG: 3-hydroxyacyl-ACP dehydratase FabZ [Pseudomonadota bacterium]
MTAEDTSGPDQENDAAQQAVNPAAGHADLERIMEMIPHRYPFLMIDAVEDIRLGESAVGIKNVTINEPHFQGHFPVKPVMPGVLLVEAMAQTSAVLVVDTLGVAGQGLLVYFMTLDKARFRKTVVPGDRVELHVKILRGRGKIWKFWGEAKVKGAVVAEAEYSAMIITPEDAREKG